MTNEFKNFAELCRSHAESRPERVAYAFCEDDVETDRLTFRQLDHSARIVATRLRERGLTGERVLLLLQSGPDFLRTFFGCMYAGAIAVPVSMPSARKRAEKIRALAKDCGAKLAVTTQAIGSALQQEGLELTYLTPEALLAGEAPPETRLAVDLEPEHPVFLQYTSGSTGTPKGVVVTHGNLLANERMLEYSFGHGDRTVFAGWLPLYHDMGLVGNVLQPMYLGITSALITPISFVQKPARWLRLISRYRATTSGAPNFAYDLCVRRVRDEQLEGVDLSSWSVAFNGAEPIRADTIERFARRFESYGFRPSASFPCYGMAEATLFISGRRLGESPRVLTVDTDALGRGRVEAVEADALAPDTRVQRIVGSGVAHPDEQLQVVDPHTRERCADGTVGEIWVSGRHIAQGYWNKPDASAQAFCAYTQSGEGPFLRTGDLGFLHDSELFVTGRIKDVIIHAGKNHYPQDLESSVASCHPAFEGRLGAAVSLAAAAGHELAIVQEVSAEYLEAPIGKQLRTRVRETVLDEHGLFATHVVLVSPGRVPMTTSGKVQRSACAEMLLNKRFDEVLLEDPVTTA